MGRSTFWATVGLSRCNNTVCQRKWFISKLDTRQFLCSYIKSWLKYVFFKLHFWQQNPTPFNSTLYCLLSKIPPWPTTCFALWFLLSVTWTAAAHVLPRYRQLFILTSLRWCMQFCWIVNITQGGPPRVFKRFHCEIFCVCVCVYVCMHAVRAAGGAKLKQAWSVGARARPMGRGSRIPALARRHTRGKKWRWVHYTWETPKRSSCRGRPVLSPERLPQNADKKSYSKISNRKCSYLFMFYKFNTLFLNTKKVNIWIFYLNHNKLTHLSLVYHSMRFTVHWFRKGPEVSLQETQAQFFAFSLLASLHRVEPIRRKVRHNISIKSKNKMHLLGPRDQVSLLETVKAHHASMGRSRLLLNSLVFVSRVLVFRIARRYLQTPDRLWFVNSPWWHHQHRRFNGRETTATPGTVVF